jgi:hypothetical protein
MKDELYKVIQALQKNRMEHERIVDDLQIIEENLQAELDKAREADANGKEDRNLKN